MKYPAKLLREPSALRGPKKHAALRDPLLPIRRSFDDDADDFASLRLGWQPARTAIRPAQPGATPRVA